ncbi:hypothetical protein IQ259_05965 [Fortiea sp. LEGE XX443]|uniref:hypothetical protein n=1 Tax=Fortiea sp. LEGE XX443 TaxID=1828611 RepID=UPI001881255C|nr:hypothetical protein [Fortiea sp. LEGE XX443]MBE9004591.1 hypothetical protein [Fortiea sp. LEGE XX443]
MWQQCQKILTWEWGRKAAGILVKLGTYCISPEYLVQAIAYNHRLRISRGFFFFYEGLRENNNALAHISRNRHYAKPAAFPSLTDLQQSSNGFLAEN